MSEYLMLNTTECSHCYKCIRNCPVKAIRFSQNQATIIEQECILCGRCFVACPQKAKSIRDNRDDIIALLESGQKVVVSLAPSFIGNFPGVGIEGMKIALKELGFWDVQETAVGASVVKKRYDEMVNNEEKNVVISSCCASVNMLIQKHFPAALPYTASILSPMLAHGTLIKKTDPDAAVVFIGPCISKKEEAAQYPGIIDGVLTFGELEHWLRDKGITLPQLEKAHSGIRTRLFPIAGGVLRTMEKSNPKYTYMSIDGVEECMTALEDIINGDISYCFIEMSACRGSCIGGPSMERDHGLVRHYAMVDISAGEAEPQSCELSNQDLIKYIPFQPIAYPRFSQSAIDEVLLKIGKSTPEDELNCGCCGYDTCRKKAEAVLAGKADLSMCLPYLMSRAQSFSDTIIQNMPNGIVVVDDDLCIQQINTTALRLMNVNSEKDVLGRNVVCLMNPEPFIQAQESGEIQHERKLYMAEYNIYVMLSVICDTQLGLCIGLIRDITQIEREQHIKKVINEQTIAVADRVIENQMKTVQEIASLLGETTAETKIALTKLKETLNDE